MEINELIIYNNDSLDIAEYYGEQLILEEDIESYDNLKNIYENIKEKDIKRLCNEIINFDNCILLQIGDVNNSKLEKLFYDNVN